MSPCLLLQFYMVATSLAPAATVHATPGLHMLCKYGIYDAHGAYLVQLYYYRCTVQYIGE